MVVGRERGQRNKQGHRDPDRPRKVAGRPNLGYCYIHSPTDASTRLAYSEALDDETRRYRPHTALSNHPPNTRCNQRLRAVHVARAIGVLDLASPTTSSTS